MAKDDLTAVQRYVLLSLMIKAAAMPNASFSNSLKADKRKDLVGRGYVEIVGERPMMLELTQRGQDRAVEELTAEQAPRTGTLGLAMSIAADFLHRLLDHTGTDPRDLFRLQLSSPVVSAAPAGTLDLDKSIRVAYQGLAKKSGDFIMLDELRDALPAVPRPELDAALVAMNRLADVHLIPESNQKVLTPRQREAAVTIGNQQRHLFGIDA